MAINDVRVQELAQRLARAMGVDQQPEMPVLRLVNASGDIHSPRTRSMDAVTRESHVRMISSLRRFYRPYGMDLIVNQALIGKGSIDDLEDEELVALLRSIDRARECIADGIGFEEAGLLHVSNC